MKQHTPTAKAWGYGDQDGWHCQKCAEKDKHFGDQHFWEPCPKNFHLPEGEECDTCGVSLTAEE